MKPRLIAIAGPLKGKSVEIEDDETSIGRDDAGGIVLNDESVSQRHCVIKRENQDFHIYDLESLNGTLVNHVPTHSRILRHQDTIRVGNSRFLFLLNEVDPEIHGRGPSLTSPGRIVSQTTIRLKLEDGYYLNSEKTRSIPYSTRITSSLQTLLRAARTIQTIRGVEKLTKTLVDLVMTALPAARCVLLLTRGNEEEFDVAFAMDRLAGPVASVSVDRSVLQHVMQTRGGILNDEVVEDSPPRSVLGVPLIHFEKILGILYLESQEPGVLLDEDHLQLAAAIAGIAAVGLDNNRRAEELEAENRRLRESVELEHNMIGESAVMTQLFDTLSRVAQTDSTVLICGESGSGKELVARAIRRNGPRADKPFVAIHCATLSENLLESELFGHERGAFTGAVSQKKGKLEVADGGTVLLDEISALSLPLQAKLLRVLQEREFERVGGTKAIQVDIRVLASTNRNLLEAVNSGTFRQDLFSLLDLDPVTVPPLRNRKEDIPLLATYFAAKYGEKTGRRLPGISSRARAVLIRYDWPGNVRELENAMERAVVLGAEELIYPEDLPETILESAGTNPSDYQEALFEAKIKIVLKALDQCSGNLAEAAKQLGLHPKNLHRLIGRLQLQSKLTR